MKHLIDCRSIVVPPRRWRETYPEAEHQDLITSITGPSGLLHAPVLRVDGDSYVLVAGGRRLRAVQEIHDLGYSFTYGGERVPKGVIPFVSLGELPYLEAREAELEENVRRLDHTWQERAIASAELLELRQQQAEAKGLPPPIPRAVAEEMTGSIMEATTAVQEMILARHLDDPDIAGASSVKEAYKALKRKEEVKKNERLAAVVGRTFTSAVHNVFHGDCKDWMEQSPPQVFDVILTDPPYSMGADGFGDSGVEGTRTHSYDDGPEVLEKIIPWFSVESWRIAKEEAHLYLFCDILWFQEWKRWLEMESWDVFRTPLIWHKPSGFRAPWPDRGPQRKYELILYATKGGRKVTKVAGDVLTYGQDASLGHAAQKPVALFADLLSRSARPGDVVLDPFAGSGPIFPAAHGLKCKAVGIEKDPGFYGLALGRMKELK